MRTIVEIATLANGAHRNQTGTLKTIPAGWAEIPAGLDKTETFPFVCLEVKGNKVTSISTNRAAWEAAQAENEQ